MGALISWGAEVCAEKGPTLLLLHLLFIVLGCMAREKERESCSSCRIDKLQAPTHLVLCPSISQARATNSPYQHVLMSKRKEGKSKSKTSFLDLLQRQWIVLLNYLWCYLGGIYRLWSGSLLEAHSLDCINLVSPSVSHMSFPLSQAWNAFYSPLLALWFICIIPTLLESEEFLLMVFGWFRFTVASLVSHAVPNMHSWDCTGVITIIIIFFMVSLVQTFQGSRVDKYSVFLPHGLGCAYARC